MQLEVISQSAQGEAKPTPILFIHGAWHGAWCWEHFLPYFAEQGYEAHAMSLRGHGASAGDVRWASLSQYADDVEQVAASFDTHPVLVGHSMGGMVLQKYLERDSSRVPAAVMLAPVPFNGIASMMLRMLIHSPGSVWEMFANGFSSYYLVNTPEKARKHFFSPTLPAEQLERYTSQLQPESTRTTLDTAFLNLPAPFRPECPLLVLGAIHDKVFPVGEIRQTARAYGVEAEFLNIAHDMMLDVGWEAVANRILAWLDEQQL